MKRLAILQVLLILAMTWFAQAQGQVYLRSVEPARGRPGEELELTLVGGGFGSSVRVAIEGLEVRDARVEPNQENVIHARVRIPEDAPPGPRRVEVVVIMGDNEEFKAALDGGFTVLEAQPRPTEIPTTRAVPPRTEPTALPPLVGRPALYGVEPREVQQDSQIELTIFGENLTEETEVLIPDRGVEVRELRFLDPSRLSARVVVRADAAPGPRLVAVNTRSGRAELPDGLIVIERQDLSWIGDILKVLVGGLLGGGIGGGLGFALGRSIALKTQVSWEKVAQLQWEVEAKKELPEPKQACTWDCKAEAKADLLNRWHIKALTLTPLPLPNGRALPTRTVAGEAVTPLNEAVRRRLEGADETRRHLAPIVDALLGQIQAWRAEGQTPASIRVDAEVKGDVKCEFALCHCEQTAAGLTWVERLKWRHTLRQPCGEVLGILRGPLADEPDFGARARGELEAQLQALVKSVRRKL